MAMAEVETTTPTYKVIILGDGATGKTTFLRRHLIGDFTTEYNATIGVEIHHMVLNTTRGNVKLEVWDIAGQHSFQGLGRGYYAGAHCGIIFFDVTSRTTYKNVPNWYSDVKRIAGHIPMVVCGNKVDIPNRKVKIKTVTFPKRHGLQYYDISVKANYNIEKPVLYLLRKLHADPKLEFSTEFAYPPPEVEISEESKKKMEADLQEADAAAIPADDSEDEELCASVKKMKIKK